MNNAYTNSVKVLREMRQVKSTTYKDPKWIAIVKVM